MALPAWLALAAWKYILSAYHEEKIEKFLSNIKQKISDSENMPEFRKTAWIKTFDGLISIMPRKKVINDTLQYSKEEVSLFLKTLWEALSELAQEVWTGAQNITNSITEFMTDMWRELSKDVSSTVAEGKKALIKIFSTEKPKPKVKEKKSKKKKQEKKNKKED